MEVLFESLLTMLRYTIIALGSVWAAERCKVEALGFVGEQPMVSAGWFSALFCVGIAHVVGTLSPVPFSAIWWVSVDSGGEWFVIWPRLLGMSCAWFVAAWCGWWQGCQEWRRRDRAG